MQHTTQTHLRALRQTTQPTGSSTSHLANKTERIIATLSCNLLCNQVHYIIQPGYPSDS